MTVTDLVRLWFEGNSNEVARNTSLRQVGLTPSLMEKCRQNAEDPRILGHLAKHIPKFSELGIDIDKAWVWTAKKRVIEAKKLKGDPFPELVTRSDVVEAIRKWSERISVRGLIGHLETPNLYKYLEDGTESAGGAIRPPIKPNLPNLVRILGFLYTAPALYGEVNDSLDFWIVNARLAVAPRFHKVCNYETFLEWLTDTVREAPSKHCHTLGVRDGMVRGWMDRARTPKRPKLREYFRLVAFHFPQWLDLKTPVPLDAEESLDLNPENGKGDGAPADGGVDVAEAGENNPAEDGEGEGVEDGEDNPSGSPQFSTTLPTPKEISRTRLEEVLTELKTHTNAKGLKSKRKCRGKEELDRHLAARDFLGKVYVEMRDTKAWDVVAEAAAEHFKVERKSLGGIVAHYVGIHGANQKTTREAEDSAT